ncbi:MAG TPA: spore coat protein U domain-containing protein [Gallionellaceae bacterium]|nr:spore coat protein U domain-containing protein [Gallionellaceae bacterium]
MKKLFEGASALIVALVATLIAAPSLAATTTATFPVNITLTSACAVTTAPGAIGFTYTSMQTAAATASTTVGIECTNTLPYSVSLGNTTLGIAGNGYSVTDTATNLAYTLTLNGVGNDLTGQTGNGAVQTVTIGGTMAANQAGTCATATCTNATSTNLNQTLTITY